MVLKHSGFCVEVAYDLKRARALFNTQTFDLLIFCHSLSLRECEVALSEVHTLHPGIKNLILGMALSACAGSEHDAHLTAFAAPAALLSIVGQLTAHLNRDIH